jgi:hypothetical protein
MTCLVRVYRRLDLRRVVVKGAEGGHELGPAGLARRAGAA